MGICSSASSKRNKKLSKEIRQKEKEHEKKVRLLLLGAGESGKSTLFKQMRLLYTEARTFTDQERDTFKTALYKNIIADIAQIGQYMAKKKLFVSTEGSQSAETVFEVLKSLKGKGKKKAIISLTEELKAAVETIWNDPATKEVWDNRAELQVQDSLEYFMLPLNFNRVTQAGFVPTNNDILRIRVRTSGIVQEQFQIDGANLEMYDVGGQESERRKWMEAFDGVTGVMFVAAISEYNQVMFENAKKNRQDDSLELFREQLHTKYWAATPFILFLNKTDLFRQKLAKVPFRVETPDLQRNVSFQGPHIDPARKYAIDGTDQEFEACYNAACNYLQALYESQNAGNVSREAAIYTKFTNSTDTAQMEHILNSCKDIILRGNLIVGGWITGQQSMEA